MRQAELARQKRLLKKKKADNDGKNKDHIPVKKMKMTEKKAEIDEKRTGSKDSKKNKLEKISKSLANDVAVNYKPSCSSNSVIVNHETEPSLGELSSLECSAEKIKHKKKVKTRKKSSNDANDSGSEYVPSEEYDSDDSYFEGESKSDKKKKNNFAKKVSSDSSTNGRQKRGKNQNGFLV